MTAPATVSLRRSLIRAVPGTGEPRPVSRLSAYLCLEYWRNAYDLASDALLDSPVGDTEALFDTAAQLEAVRLKVVAATNRYRRAGREAEGRKWLRSVDETGRSPGEEGRK